jgi:hypothetical protein
MSRQHSGSSNGRSSPKATIPSALHKFLDKPLATGSLRGGASTYNASLSWDGMSVDPRPFARFDEHNTVTDARHPAGRAGARVVELEGHGPGGLFGRAATSTGSVPMTVEQEITHCLSTDAIAAAGSSSHVIMEEPFFNSAQVVVPALQVVLPPAALVAGGPQSDACLLAPKARREINDYESKQQRAARVLRKAQHQQLRLQYLLKHHHPNGALQVDSEVNPATEVYRDRAAKRHARESSEAATVARYAVEEFVIS